MRARGHEHDFVAAGEERFADVLRVHDVVTADERIGEHDAHHATPTPMAPSLLGDRP